MNSAQIFHPSAPHADAHRLGDVESFDRLQDECHHIDTIEVRTVRAKCDSECSRGLHTWQ